MLTLAMMFKDGMVVQRDRRVAVFGMTTDREHAVTVSMQGKQAQAMPAAKAPGTGNDTGGANACWLAEIGPFDVTEGEEMVISQNGETIILHDVAVGDVFLAGGQSNMEFAMKYDRNYPGELAALTKVPNPHIRFFDYPEVSYVGELEEADYSENYGFWRKADADNLQWWSAVAFYFAKEIQGKYQVPVGIIGCSWGGTNIGTWLPAQVLKECGAGLYLEQYATATKDLDLEAYDKAFRANPMSFRTNQLYFQGSEVQDFVMYGNYGEDMMAQMMRKVQEMTARAGLSIEDMKKAATVMQLPIGPKDERRPGGLYEAMLLPIVPYTIRAILWYQGESDGDDPARGALYEKTFPALIAHYRKLFGGADDASSETSACSGISVPCETPARTEASACSASSGFSEVSAPFEVSVPFEVSATAQPLPFLFVQLAPYEKWMTNSGKNYGVVRMAQEKTAQSVPGTGMVVTTDAGMRWDIHPVIKKVVGHRLALQALDKVYGEKNVFCEAPTLAEIHIEEGQAELVFRNCGTGLHLSTQSLYGDAIPADTLQGARLVLAGGQSLPSESCHAEVSTQSPDTVILTSPAIHKDDVSGAAIADGTWYQINLYNSADIPARPARIRSYYSRI